MACEICNASETVNAVVHLGFRLCWVCLRIKASVMREQREESEDAIVPMSNHLIPTRKQ